MRSHLSIIGALASTGAIICLTASEPVAAQNALAIRSDVMTVFGYYGVTGGNSNRRFATAWGNAYFQNGIGVHAELQHMEREETADYLAGALSWRSSSTELRAWLGTSSGNVAILPELYARIEGTYWASPATGITFSPAVSYRSFRNGAEEATLEAQFAKYMPLDSGTLVLTAFGRATAVNPGDHISGSLGTGLIYTHTGEFSVGIHVEGGRAAYDGLLAPGKLDELYASIRSNVSFVLTDDVELTGLMEYSKQESYSVYGGQIGLKFYFGQSRGVP